MAYKTSWGRTLLNPSEKGRKYTTELKTRKMITNDFQPKLGKDGKQKTLEKEHRAYRAGYLDAQRDSHNAFMAKNPNYKRKTTIPKRVRKTTKKK